MWRQGFSILGFSASSLLMLYVAQRSVALHFPALEADVFFTSLIIPLTLVNLLGMPLFNVLIPYFARQVSGEAKELRSITQGVFLVSLALSILLILSAPVWSRWLGSGFSDEQLIGLVKLSWIFLAVLPFSAAAGVLNSRLISEKRNLLAEVVNAGTALLALVGVYISLQLGSLMGAGMALAGRDLWRFVTVLIVTRRDWLQPSPKGAFKKALRLAWQPTAAALFIKFDPFVDRHFLSFAPPGGLSLFHLMQQIFNAGSSVLNASVTMTSISDVSRLYHAGHWLQCWRLFIRRVLLLVGAAGLGLVVLFFLPMSFWRLLLGAIPADVSISPLLLAFAGYFIFGLLGSWLSLTLYAFGEQRLQLVLSAANLVLSVGAKSWLFPRLGVAGVAWGSSIYLAFSALVMLLVVFWRLRRAPRIGP